MPAEQFIKAILADWHEWQDAGVRIDSQPHFERIFNDGSNHDVALLTLSYQGIEQSQVLKCFSGAHPGAIESQQWASELGLAPPINYTDSDFTYCLMPYIKAPSIRPEGISSADLQAIAKSLSVAHSAPIGDVATSLGMFDLQKFCEGYLERADDRAERIHQKMIAPLNEFISDATPMSFCHNDLVAGNCFVVNGHAQFIDWEYAQLHNPWFDLAAIIYYLQLDNKQAAAFLDDYEAGWSVFVGTSIFYTSQLSLLWADMLWHLSKFGPEFWPRLEVKLNDLEQLLRIKESLGSADLF